jgi:hypothetical protein
MASKCRKCIDYYAMKRRRLEAIKDVQNKNEGFAHAVLKSQVCELMRELGRTDQKKSVETEVPVKGIGKVDVVATIGDATIAIECGSTKPEKIQQLMERFDIVLHVPYCYTQDLYGLKEDVLKHQIFVANVLNRFETELKTKGIGRFERGKRLCVESGECSLPSGRKGFPHEAIQIASAHTEEEQAE